MYGWIHFLDSREKAITLTDILFKRGSDIYPQYIARINNLVFAKDGRIFGKKGEKTLVLMINSVSLQVVDDFIEKGLFTRDNMVNLTDLRDGEVEDTEERGIIVKKAEYLPFYDYDKYINELV